MKAYLKSSVTNETFSAQIKVLDKSGRELRRLMQSLLLCALGDYADTGSSGKLLQLYKRATTFGLDKKKVLGFIKACANVKLENEGKKNAKFINRNKQGNVVTPPTDWWYNFEAEESANAQAPLELAKMLAQFEARIQREAKVTGKLAVGDRAKVAALSEYLKAYTGLNEADHVAPELAVVKAA